MKKNIPVLSLTSLLLLLLLFSSGCNPLFSRKQPISSTFLQFDTVITITLYDSREESLLEECRQLCAEYETLFSRTLEGSEIHELNENYEAGVPWPVSDEVYSLLSQTYEYSERTNGAFSLFLEPLTSLWDFSGEGASASRPPAAAEIADRLSDISYEDVLLENGTVAFSKEGMGIDAGGAAKGYIADRLKEYLLSRGVKSAIIDLGGNILCIGEKPDGSPFRIGIKKPFGSAQESLAVAGIRDRSLVSSGVYERYFLWEEKLYHHILDPSTGYPCDNDLLGVTILSDSSLQGDILSTACLVLGLEQGMELLEQFPEAEGLFVTKDYALHYTEGFPLAD